MRKFDGSATHPSSERLDDHRHPVARTEEEHRPGLDAITGGDLKTKRPGRHGDGRVRLPQGELLADAAVRAGLVRSTVCSGFAERPLGG